MLYTIMYNPLTNQTCAPACCAVKARSSCGRNTSTRPSQDRVTNTATVATFRRKSAQRSQPIHPPSLLRPNDACGGLCNSCVSYGWTPCWFQISAMSAEQLAAFTPEQLAALSPEVAAAAATQ
eukprot:2686596-Pyramimonas_sp.AAC.1